ncbi:hypothetical protein CYMTET_28717 [Cymbomonas tetramitiformis]|uniref:Uncharacterized protein n=1 Tax=Cymbomonas tetramitiformis TaxID=36881 RepID=A0AAE0KVW9_9CHLO|nr:hypothetical protein CYMTET_28717 [Cymbomonas tetramitiformis]
MMAFLKIVGAFGIVAAFLCNSIQVRRIASTLGGEFAKEIPHSVFDDERCTVLHADLGIGLEDVTWLNKRWAFISSDDRVELWETKDGAKTTANGNIFLFDNTEVKLSALPLQNFPESVAFHPHGIFLRKADAERAELFVINHAYFQGGERIEVFSVHTDLEGSFISLIWKYSIDPPIFQTDAMGVLNDLVLVSPNGFFVTRYMNLADSPAGRGHNSLKTRFFNDGLFTALLPPLQTTEVYYCNFSETHHSLRSPDAVSIHTECHVAAGGFAMANGITITDQGKIFVVDVLQLSVWAVAHNRTDNTLTKLKEIRLPNAVDNVEFDEDSGNIYMGALPNLFHPTEVGGALQMQTKEPYTVVNIMQTTKLGQVSCAARSGSTLLVGSPIHRGLLYCPGQF